MSGEFSVCQFFPGGDYGYELRFVDAETAMVGAKAIIQSVGGRLGTTERVIVTDGGDCIVFEWQHGKGITFPDMQTI